MRRGERERAERHARCWREVIRPEDYPQVRGPGHYSVSYGDVRPSRSRGGSKTYTAGQVVTAAEFTRYCATCASMRFLPHPHRPVKR